MFALLTIATFMVFEPRTTMAAVRADNSIYWRMIGEAMPMTAVLTVGAAFFIGWIYGRSLKNFAVLLVTCSILMFLLGHNISAMGLVAIPRSSYYLVGEMLGLVVALNVVYAGAFMLLERKRLGGTAVKTAPIA